MIQAIKEKATGTVEAINKKTSGTVKALNKKASGTVQVNKRKGSLFNLASLKNLLPDKFSKVAKMGSSLREDMLSLLMAKHKSNPEEKEGSVISGQGVEDKLLEPNYKVLDVPLPFLMW